MVLEEKTDQIFKESDKAEEDEKPYEYIYTRM